MSMATSRKLTNCLAAVTYWLPGPNILYTFGMLSVPYAMAAMACTPPACRFCSILPHVRQRVRRGVFSCLFPGTAQNDFFASGQFAGTASISTVENSGAVPPGMYKPTFSMPTAFASK